MGESGNPREEQDSAESSNKSGNSNSRRNSNKSRTALASEERPLNKT